MRSSCTHSQTKLRIPVFVASSLGGSIVKFFIFVVSVSSIVVVVDGFLPRIAVQPSAPAQFVVENTNGNSNNKNQICSTGSISFPKAHDASSSFGLRVPVSKFQLSMARRNMNMNRRAPPKEKKPPMNEEITFTELRVTTPNSKGKDEPLGIMSRDEALAKARAMGGVDLILVNPNSDPPVCKIADYSKYRYMKEKKAKELKKNSKATEVKEVKMSYKIDIHDYDVRKKNALKFLNQGNRVKCSVMFRGREIQHDKLGFDLLDKLAEDMEAVCVREGRPKREGRTLSMIVNPRPEVVKQVNADRRAEEKAKRKKKEERQMKKKAAAEEKEATAVAAATAAAASAVNGLNGSSMSSSSSSFDGARNSNDKDDMIDLEADIESSLDNLFGSDDLTDDLFS